MKIVYPICCGGDVHKTFLVATIIISKGITPHYLKKRFSTFNNSILQFKQWLIDNNCFDMCMESTRKYWVPVHNLLEDTIHITIANPKWVRAIKGNMVSIGSYIINTSKIFIKNNIIFANYINIV